MTILQRAGRPWQRGAGAAASEPADPSLLADWPLDEAAGASAALESVASNHAALASTISGRPTIVTGGDASTDFDGTARAIADHRAAYAVGEYTMVAYCQPSALPGAGSSVQIVNRDRGTAGANGVARVGGVTIEQYNDGGTSKLRGYTRDGTPSAVWIGSSAGVATLALHTAHIVAVSVDPARSPATKMFLRSAGGSASAVATSTNTEAWAQNDSQLWIGQFPNSAGSFEGLIQSVQIYDTAFEAADIDALPAPVTAVVARNDVAQVEVDSVDNNLGVLANDSGLPTNRTITITQAPGSGAANVVSNGTPSADIQYDAPGSAGNATIKYTVNGSNEATVAVETVEASSSIGISLPQFGYTASTYALVGGEVWWNPTSGSDGNSGNSKGAAKKTFAAVEAIASTTKPIVVTGTPGSTVYHVVPTIVPTKSGTSGAKMKLVGEPGCTVVLVHETNADMLGALNQTWSWSTVDAGRKIYQSPVTFSDADTTFSPATGGGDATVNSALMGIVEIPGGALGQIHLMALPWIHASGMTYDGDGMANTTEQGYNGPWVAFKNGRVQVRLQPPTEAMTGGNWPTDGVMGDLIGPDGNWVEPSQHPNNYRIHLVRRVNPHYWGANANTEMFNFVNVDHWLIKGLNTDLHQGFAQFSGNTGIEFEDMTRYWFWHDCHLNGQTDEIKNTRVQSLTWDLRHVPWRGGKGGGKATPWYQWLRSAHMFSRQSVSFSGAADWLWDRCTFHGAYDTVYFENASGKRVRMKFLRCAFLQIYDDGFIQDSAAGPNDLEIGYCFFYGAPMLAGGGSGASTGNGNTEWYIYHSIFDCRVPTIWLALGAAGTENRGVGCHQSFTHSSDNARAKKMWNCTWIGAPCAGKDWGRSLSIDTDSAGRNPALSSWAHECYNNLFTCMANQIYTIGTNNDALTTRVSCQASTAGIHRFDYNLYWRQIPRTPSTALLYQYQDHKDASKASYSTLAAFKASAHYTTSASMYSDGTNGHEENGVEANPQFRDIPGFGPGAALDYRPQGSGASGAKNLGSTGWPGAAAKTYKGALDPAGEGNEVGPLAP